VTREGADAEEREHLEIAHHHPGRLRVRADVLIEALDLVQRIRESLDAEPGILSVKYTAQTGSLLVQYEPGHADADVIILRIADAADLDPPLDEATLRERRARPALLAIGATRELNRLTEEVTGGRADLRSLVPAALAGLAAYSFLGEKQRMPRWDNLLYWGFNVFTMLHKREIDGDGDRPPRAAE
jgi:Heavy metal associated domain 2